MGDVTNLLAHGNDAQQMGQQSLDQRAQLEQLRAAGVLQDVQYQRVDADALVLPGAVVLGWPLCASGSKAAAHQCG